MNKQNILTFIYDFRPANEGDIGGTTLHLIDLIRNLKAYYNFHVIHIRQEKTLLTSFIDGKCATYELGNFTANSKLKFFNKDFHDSIADLVDKLHINLIHIHNVVNMPMDAFKVAHEKDIPLIFTFHDYYALCPSINLISGSRFICDYTHPELCRPCFSDKFHVDANPLPLWRKTFHENLRQADFLIAPSNCAADIVNHVWPDLNIKVIPHGIDKQASDYVTSSKSKRLNIAFIGNIVDHKGSKYLYKLKEKVKNNSNITIHLFGSCNIASCREQDAHYIYHGPYIRQDIQSLLKHYNIDVVCLLSTCAETYSYTLSESLAAEIPVIAFQIGAIAERIKEIDGGWLFPLHSTTDEIFKFLQTLQSPHREELEEKKQNIRNYLPKMKTVNDMAEEYHSIYDRLIANKPISSNALSRNDYFHDTNEKKFIDDTLFLDETPTNELLKDKERQAYLYVKTLIKSKRISIHFSWKELSYFCRMHKTRRWNLIFKFIFYKILAMRFPTK